MSTTTPETPQTGHAPEGGMFGPYVPPTIGEPMDELAKLPSFVLLGAVLREKVATAYGLRTAVDLQVATTVPGEIRVFSGFAAGVVGQVRRKADGELPAVVALHHVQLERGATLELALVQPIAAGADVAALAAAQPAPLPPKAA